MKKLYKFKCNQEKWNNFVKNASWDRDEASNKNFTEDFGNLSKKWGKAYLSYLEASYLAKDEMSDEDFCKMNGNVPMSFIEEYLK